MVLFEVHVNYPNGNVGPDQANRDPFREDKKARCKWVKVLSNWDRILYIIHESIVANEVKHNKSGERQYPDNGGIHTSYHT